MMGVCEADGCDMLVDVDGYVPEVHGPVYCWTHQPRCKVCKGDLFKGECWRCDKEAWALAKAKITERLRLDRGLTWEQEKPPLEVLPVEGVFKELDIPEIASWLRKAAREWFAKLVGRRLPGKR
jgi:hypothetical protein